MEQMEWREALDDAQGEGDLEQVSEQVLQRRREMLGRIQQLLDLEGDAPAAAQQVRALMFIERFGQDVQARFEQLGQ